MTSVNKNPEYFLTIAAEHSVSKAAEKLYVSQSYLSQYVAKLEKELNVRLLDRSKSPIELTDAGRIYVSYLESCSRLYQKLTVDLAALNVNHEQTLTMGFSNWRGSTLLPDILPGYEEQYPHVKVILKEHPISGMYKLIENGEVDFVIMNTSLQTPATVTMETVTYEKILLCGNRSNPIAQQLAENCRAGEPFDWHLLENEPFILLAPELTLAKRVNNYLDKKQVVLKKQTVTTNTSTSLNLTAANLGFSFINETGLFRVPHPDDLIFFELDTADLQQPLSVVYKKDSYLSTVARAFINLTIEYYAKQKNMPLPANIMLIRAHDSMK